MYAITFITSLYTIKSKKKYDFLALFQKDPTLFTGMNGQNYIINWINVIPSFPKYYILKSTELTIDLFRLLFI